MLFIFSKFLAVHLRSYFMMIYATSEIKKMDYFCQ